MSAVAYKTSMSTQKLTLITDSAGKNRKFSKVCGGIIIIIIIIIIIVRTIVVAQCGLLQ